MCLAKLAHHQKSISKESSGLTHIIGDRTSFIQEVDNLLSVLRIDPTRIVILLLCRYLSRPGIDSMCS